MNTNLSDALYVPTYSSSTLLASFAAGGSATTVSVWLEIMRQPLFSFIHTSVDLYEACDVWPLNSTVELSVNDVTATFPWSCIA